MEIIKPFKPYYDRKLGHVTSRKQEERALRASGMSFNHDHKAMKAEAKHILKHKDEFLKAEYKAQGVNYDPARHKNMRFDEKKREFVR